MKSGSQDRQNPSPGGPFVVGSSSLPVDEETAVQGQVPGTAPGPAIDAPPRPGSGELPLLLEATPRPTLRVLPPRRRRAKEVQAFYGISRLGAMALGPAEAGRRALAAIVRALEMERAEVWLVRSGSKVIERLCAHGSGLPAAPPEAHYLRQPFTRRLAKREQGLCHPAAGAEGGAAAAEGGAAAAEGRAAARHPAWPGLTSMCGAPIRGRGRLLGFLYADRGGVRFDLTASELELLSALSSLAGEVIVGALDRQVEARRHRHVILLNRVNRLIGVEDRLPVLLPRLARIIRARTGCVGVNLRLYEARERGLRVVACVGPGGQAFVGQICTIVRGRGSLAPGVLAFLSEKPILVNSPRPLPSTESYFPGIHSAMIIPIRAKGKTIGVLRLEATRRFTFAEDDVKLFCVLGEQIGHAIERARVLEELRSSQESLRALSAGFERKIEAERQRLARLLHDGIAQSMTAARLKLGLLDGRPGGGRTEIRKATHEISELISRSIDQIRTVSMDLRPAMLDELGLLPALRWYASTFEKSTGIRVAVRARDGDARPARAHETLLFRFVQDALANVERRGRARRVRVGLGQDRGVLRVEVWDDGASLSVEVPADARLDLLGMRERMEWAGGGFTSESTPRRGNKVVGELPIGAPRAGGGNGGLP